MNMKSLIAHLALAAAIVMPCTAFGDTIQVDQTFTKAKEWLSEQKLSLTGGPNGARDDQAAFGQETLLFYGEAYGNPAHQNPAQREGMAKRAAVVTAQRALVEYLEGFALVGDTLVKDGIANYDLVRSSVAGYVKGVQAVYQDYSKEKDTAIAFVKVGLHGPTGFGSLMYEKLLGDPNAKKLLESGKPAFKTTPTPLGTEYDGLIIDASAQSFQPALINRIFTPKGELIYDPAKLEKQVLVEQGCGEYTKSIEKAQSALATRGVKNPLIIKASGSLSRADLQVGEEDARTIFSANLKNSFLAGARVAFVLQ